MTRDYAYGIKDKNIRKAKLVPWNEDEDLDDLEDIDNDEDPTVQPEPDISYFTVDINLL